jgi:hypothetical protein
MDRSFLQRALRPFGYALALLGWVLFLFIAEVIASGRDR